MSNLSIFDKKWLDVVFDGKNKEYGAYQLRQETQKTSLRAFAFGTTIVFSCIGIFTLSSFFSTDIVIEPEPEVGKVINVTTINPPIIDVVIPEPISEKSRTEKVFSDKSELVNVVISKPIEATQSIVDNKDNGKTTNNPDAGTILSTNKNPSDGNTASVVAPIKLINNDVNDPRSLDKQPNFPGGLDKFRNFVGINFEKPELDEERILTVKVSFVVEKDGSLSNIKVQQDPGYGLGDEAIRVLKSLKTKWEPGIIDGEKVRTLFSLPISIKTE